MSGGSLIIDTNIALYFPGGDETLSFALAGKTIYRSFISELELLCSTGMKKDEEKVVEQFIENCVVIDMNREIKRKAAEFRKRYAFKLPDAIIAATAEYLPVPS